MYLPQAWDLHSEQGVEDAMEDSYAMRLFRRLDVTPSSSRMLRTDAFPVPAPEARSRQEIAGVAGESFEEPGWFMCGRSLFSRRSSPRDN
jgi:hypothetical protein